MRIVLLFFFFSSFVRFVCETTKKRKKKKDLGRKGGEWGTNKVSTYKAIGNPKITTYHFLFFSFPFFLLF